ncbi:C-terminal processing protease CtpA/Prc [Ancylomarina subtilis]|uniref:C-terminal processing protease CtpA/Prc n=1 Tax=Ancylomarina subtilis TaxID=1639035 RepID=A0A4Q7VI04_9BACT|nr:S41 family peptidase [Ancylomarina subtilis]RZT95742.1 C-terminal processing protease CtpA/Prc [Ancylomarina subtilis]
MQKLHLSLILIFLAGTLFGQKNFSAKEIQEDIDFFQKTLVEVHPNPFKTLSETSFNHQLELVINQLNYPCSQKDFYLMFSPIVAKLGDAHTGVYYYPQNILLFPLELKKVQNRIIISCNFTDNKSIQPGTELVAINDISTIEIIDSLTNYESGEVRSLREDFLLSSDFPYLLYTVYGFKDTFKLTLRVKDEVFTSTTKINGLLSDSLDVKKESLAKQPFSMFINENMNLALLTINTFEYGYLDEFKMFLKNSIHKIKGKSISNLIIDIRENDGGSSSLGDELLRYISDKEFCQESKEILKVSQSYLNQNDSKLKDRIGSIKTTITGLNHLIKPYPCNKRFSGQVYILIGPHTFSAGSEFAVAVKDYGLGIFIGEETGGRATSFGEMQGFFLPNTRLRFGISCKKFFRPNQTDDGKGVMPDFYVPRNFEDLCHNIDTVLNFTKNLILDNGQ